MKSALLVAGIAFLTGCQKDVSEFSSQSSLQSKAAVEKTYQKHNIKGELTGIAHVIPASEVGGYFAGTATGHSNMLGKFSSIFNSYFNFIGETPEPFAPVTMFFNESNNDFLRDIDIDVEDLSQVSVISYDEHGNSLWAHIESTNIGTSSGDRYYNQATYQVVGGTGKFEGATGLYTLTGYYTNPLVDPSEIAYNIEGDLYLPKR